jgi:putative ABC transport system permease protein
MYTNKFFRIQAINLKQNLVTIFGLAVSLSVIIISIAYLVFENSYNNFFPGAGNIFLVKTDIYFESGRQVISESTSHNLSEYLIKHSPEIVQSCRVRSFQDNVKIEDSFFRQQVVFADREYLDIFGIETIKGTDVSFGEPDRALITKSLEDKIFGGEASLGKQILFRDRTYRIAGIVKDLPSNSTIGFDVILPLGNYVSDNDPGKYFLAVNTFVKTRSKLASMDNIDKVATDYYASLGNTNTKCFSLGLTGIYKEHKKEGKNTQNAFIIIAISVLAVSVINFANKFAARNESKLRGFAIRKSFGASLGSVMSLIFSDAAVITLSSLVLGLLICDFTLPAFRDLVGVDLSLLGKGLILTPALVLFLIIFVALIVSIPSAIRFASITVVKILNGLEGGAKKLLSPRKVPLVFQFIVSLTLLTYLLIQGLQLKYLSDYNYGIETDNRLLITLNRKLMGEYMRFAQNIREIPGVISISGKAQKFGDNYGADISLPDWDKDTRLPAYGFCVQDNFFDVMGIEIVEGLSFADYPGRDSSRFIIDRYTADLLGLEDPVGSTIKDDFITGEIIAVVENTNLVPLDFEKRPVIYNQIKNYASELVISYKGASDKLIEALLIVLKQYDPDYILEYQSLDERMAGFYKKERNNLKLISWLAALALMLCLSGVYSIVSNRVESERKNISLKKLMGASMRDLNSYFGREILYLILCASLISVPLAYILSENWLNDYTEKIKIGLLPFVLSILMVAILSLIPVLIKHTTIARINPVENLRSE